MAPLRQPTSLLELSGQAVNRFTIWYAYWGLEPSNSQFQELQLLMRRTVPAKILQDLLQSVMKMAATEYCLTARAISFLLQLYIHPRSTEMVLSDLAYMGDVTLEDLDYVENCLEGFLPELTCLTYIDLSTNLNKCTWPSCSPEMLNIIGSYCPNLTILNLNNNNRVNGESLFYLFPSRERTGCPLLEKLYIQDSSVEPFDVSHVLWRLPNLALLGYKEIGSALTVLHRWRKRKKHNSQHILHLTHFENTESRLNKTDGKLLPLLNKYAPKIINLKVRINDNDSCHLVHFRKLRHLEIRCFNERDVHDTLGPNTLNFIRSHGKYLYSLTICCTVLYNRQVSIIAEHCMLLEKLILYSNSWDEDIDLSHSINNLRDLQFLSLRIGDDELVQSPNAASLVTFLLKPCSRIEEIYLLLRSSSITHEYFLHLFSYNPFPSVHTLILDAPRRTMSAPMLDLTHETANFFIENLLSLKILGNLISWAIDEIQMNKLRLLIKESNYDIKLIRMAASRINTKYFF